MPVHLVRGKDTAGNVIIEEVVWTGNDILAAGRLLSRLSARHHKPLFRCPLPRYVQHRWAHNQCSCQNRWISSLNRWQANTTQQPFDIKLVLFSPLSWPASPALPYYYSISRPSVTPTSSSRKSNSPAAHFTPDSSGRSALHRQLDLVFLKLMIKPGQPEASRRYLDMFSMSWLPGRPSSAAVSVHLRRSYNPN